MSKPIICIVVGARPEMIRMAPLIKVLSNESSIDLKILHTGQHYSDYMSKVFFEELDIPEPYINLNVGSDFPYLQTHRVFRRAGEEFKRLRPNLVCVWGDTNSSLGVALAANKLNLKLAHIEAGCRSNDKRMAEEYNRRMIDHVSDILFPLSNFDEENLKREGVLGKIYNVGDPLYDVFLERTRDIDSEQVKRKYNVDSVDYALMTMHRAENVDVETILSNVLKAITSMEKYKVLFSVHPRTKKMIGAYNLDSYLDGSNVMAIPPLGYLDLMGLVLGSSFVITDSGGLQKEAFFAKKSCLTLRKSTEWVDTVKFGVNVLVDPEFIDLSERLNEYVSNLVTLNEKFDFIEDLPYGEGNASERIVEIILEELKDV